MAKTKMDTCVTSVTLAVEEHGASFHSKIRVQEIEMMQISVQDVLDVYM